MNIEPRSLLFGNGVKIYLLSGDSILLGRGGATSILVDDDILKADSDPYSMLDSVLGFDSRRALEILEISGKLVKVKVHPDIYLWMLPLDLQNKELTKSISAKHIFLKWNKDNVQIRDAGSSNCIWDGDRKIESPETIKKDKEFSIASVLDLKFKLHKSSNQRTFAVTIERVNNCQEHRYIFFRNDIPLTFGPGKSCDIRIEGEGPDLWGLIYVRDSNIGFELLEGAPRLKIHDDREIDTHQFIVFSLGLKMIFDGGPEFFILDNSPINRQPENPEPVKIIALAEHKKLQTELKNVLNDLKDGCNPSGIFDFLKLDIPDSLYVDALSGLGKMVANSGDDLILHSELIYQNLNLIEAFCSNSNKKIASKAQNCRKKLIDFLRRHWGAKLTVNLFFKDTIVVGDNVMPEIVIENLGNLSARNISLKLESKKCTIDDDDLDVMVCEILEPTKSFRINDDVEMVCELAGKIKVKALLQFDDDLDNSRQSEDGSITFQVNRAGTAEQGPMQITIDTFYGGGSNIFQGDAILRNSKLNADSAKEGQNSGTQGSGSNIFQGDAIIRNSNINAGSDSGKSDRD